LNLRPSGYEPDELPDCSTPRRSEDRDQRSEDRPRWAGLGLDREASRAGEDSRRRTARQPGAGGRAAAAAVGPSPVELGRSAMRPISVLCPLLSALCSLPSALCPLISELGRLARPGDDPLSHPFEGSTLGAVRFHGRVRNGVGWGPHAVITRSRQQSRGQRAEGRGQETPEPSRRVAAYAPDALMRREAVEHGAEAKVRTEDSRLAPARPAGRCRLRSSAICHLTSDL
jgi:hypothetical protein